MQIPLNIPQKKKKTLSNNELSEVSNFAQWFPSVIMLEPIRLVL